MSVENDARSLLWLTDDFRESTSVGESELSIDSIGTTQSYTFTVSFERSGRTFDSTENENSILTTN